MITKEMIKWGLRRGIVTLIDSPQSDGTVCRIDPIGSTECNWFYFGGLTAEELTAEEYKKNVPEDDIVSEIFDVLDSDMKGSFESGDEYNYYEAVLVEGGCSELKKTLTVIFEFQDGIPVSDFEQAMVETGISGLNCTYEIIEDGTWRSDI